MHTTKEFTQPICYLAHRCKRHISTFVLLASIFLTFAEQTQAFTLELFGEISEVQIIPPEETGIYYYKELADLRTGDVVKLEIGFDLDCAKMLLLGESNYFSPETITGGFGLYNNAGYEIARDGSVYDQYNLSPTRFYLSTLSGPALYDIEVNFSPINSTGTFKLFVANTEVSDLGGSGGLIANIYETNCNPRDLNKIPDRVNSMVLLCISIFIISQIRLQQPRKKQET